MIYLDPTWLPTITEVLVIGGGLMFYMANWRARHRLRKVRYANMLLAELKTLHDIANVKGAHGADHTSIENSAEILPHNVYDGLVSSTNPSYFDRSDQDRIHLSYELIIKHNRKFERGGVARTDLFGPSDKDGEPRYLEGELRRVIYTVTQFRDKNQPDKR